MSASLLFNQNNRKSKTKVRTRLSVKDAAMRENEIAKHEAEQHLWNRTADQPAI
jgi:hypothetical protein